MAKFNERLKLLRRESGLSQQDFAKQLGTSKRSDNMYELGQRQPRRETLEAKAENLFPIERKRYPLIGTIACGKPITANEEKELYVEAGAEIEADFCLRAKGDSMIRARIYDGDIVFIRKQSMVDNGEIAAVVIDDEATLKRVNYYPEKNLLILKAENPDYEDLVYTGEQLDHIIILGKAVAFQSDVR